MVETIVPIVHGSRRSYRVAVALHAAGATASAALVGAVLGGLGALLGLEWNRAGLIPIAIVGIAYAAREMFGAPIPLPQLKRQVPEWWRSFFGPKPAALYYGVGLGAAYFTYLSFGTFVGVSAAAFTSGNPAIGALLCAPFGAARGLSVLVSRSVTEARDAEAVVERMSRLAESGRPRLVNGAALVMLTAAVVVALF